MRPWIELAVFAFAAVFCLWIGLAVASFTLRRSLKLLQTLWPLVPHILKLLRSMATDTRLPLGVRVRIWGLLAYLILPIDLVPDFLPVVGRLDDILLTYVVLRSALKRLGPDLLRKYWTGNEEGLQTLETVMQVRTQHKPKSMPKP